MCCSGYCWAVAAAVAVGIAVGVSVGAGVPFRRVLCPEWVTACVLVFFGVAIGKCH